jgi:predicted deacylase
MKAPAGALTRFELPVSRLPTGMWVSLPVGVLHGARPGPVIWVSATMHGDELNGVPIIRHLLLDIDPKSLAGTLLAVPIVNIFGLLQESRYLPDRRDLNRCFPGARRGSSASQLANLFMTKVVAHCELGIDLHTGSGGRVNLPQIRCNLDDPDTFRLAKGFGAPLLLHSRLRDGSLRAAATELGKRVLLYEAGEANRFNSRPIRIGVNGILRVMEALGMIDARAPRPDRPPWVSRSSKWARAPRTGFCEMSAKLGDQVEQGQELAVIFNALTPEGTSVKAKMAGVVIGLLKTPLVHRGDAIAHVARIDS